MKNSGKNNLHKPKEQGLKLEETYPQRKKVEKNKINCINSKSKSLKPEKTSLDKKQLVLNMTRMDSKISKDNDQAPLLPR